MPNYDQIIRQAKYIAPSGATVIMQFDDVERSSGKKYAVHELPQQDAPIVQDQGKKATEYPFSCYFSGETAYNDADALDAALSEIGPGTFEHPMFGNLDVLADTWAETRKLVDGLGRVDFSIHFVYAPKIKPLSSGTAASAAESVTESTTAATDASVNKAAADFNPANAADKAKSKAGVLKNVSDFADNFREMAASVSEVSSAIARQVRTITNTIDDLIEAPLELFNALSTLAKLPATVTTGLANKIASYREQALSIAESIPASYAQAVASVESLIYDFAGASEASTIGDLTSRSEASAVADSLGSITETVLAYIEATEAAVPGYLADHDIVQALVNAASLARSSVLERAFSLRSERRITLDVETTPLNLIAQFYGDRSDGVPDLDAALNDIIATNNLQGDAILVIPAGREVIYYA